MQFCDGCTIPGTRYASIIDTTASRSSDDRTSVMFYDIIIQNIVLTVDTFQEQDTLA